MNPRVQLENEINRYFTSEEHYNALRKWDANKEAAIYFYNLALEDVRKEVERRVAELQKWIDCQYGGDEKSRQDELFELRNFIDQLSK